MLIYHFIFLLRENIVLLVQWHCAVVTGGSMRRGETRKRERLVMWEIEFEKGICAWARVRENANGKHWNSAIWGVHAFPYPETDWRKVSGTTTRRGEWVAARGDARGWWDRGGGFVSLWQVPQEREYVRSVVSSYQNFCIF